MHYRTILNDPELSPFREMPSASLRGLDGAEIGGLWARRLLATADLTPSQRQNLRDIGRLHRKVSTNRSTFATLLEMSHLAPSPADALYGLTLMRVAILGRSEYALPCPDHAHVIEERSNHDGNLAQLEHKQRRSRSTLEQLVFVMGQQQLASETLADAEIGAMRRLAVG